MPYLAAAVLLVAMMCLVDLVVTLGVVRRLREHALLLNQVASGKQPPTPAVMLPTGARVAEFAATTTDGEPVARHLLTNRTLVGFFSPNCDACHEQLPQFAAYAQAMPAGRTQVTAVVVGETPDTPPLVSALSPVARVVVEPYGGVLATAFGANAFPALCVVDGKGIVVASGHDLSALPSVSR